MSTSVGHPPIYQALLDERGDIPADTRTAAERIQREVAQLLDWRGPGIQRALHDELR